MFDGDRMTTLGKTEIALSKEREKVNKLTAEKEELLTIIRCCEVCFGDCRKMQLNCLTGACSAVMAKISELRDPGDMDADRKARAVDSLAIDAIRSVPYILHEDYDEAKKKAIELLKKAVKQLEDE